MDLRPSNYTFTINDTHRIINLGYLIKHSCSISLEEFMAYEFPNFDLCTLLKELEASFSITTPLPIKREIIFDNKPPELQINYRNSFSEIQEALVFNRKFYKSKIANIEVEHQYCVLPHNYQGKGILSSLTLRSYYLLFCS